MPRQPLQSPAGGNLLVVEVRLDNYLVSDGLTAQQIGNRVLLPLGELARLLTIAIKTQPEQGIASGFILSEERPFNLSVKQGLVQIGQRSETLDPDLVLVQPDDIYVASELLARWLPIGLELNFSSLILTVSARELLPLQRRLQRERQAGQARPRYDADPGYPRRHSPYAMWGMPFIDHTLSTELVRRDDKWKASARQTTFLTGDLLGLESAFFISGSERDPVSDFRATFGRNDPSATLLGPLRARAFAFGNIPVPALANVARTSPIGNGLLLSNVPLTRPVNFRSQSFQGDLPPGWDVELFFNDALIGFMQSRPDGRYVFEDVPIVYGVNDFRLVFHGPQGQIRVERQNFQLQDTLTKPGEFHYHLVGHHSDDGDPRGYAQFDFGLNDHVSATGGAVTTTLNGVNRTYANVGLRSQWRGFFVTGDVVRSDTGTLAEVGVLTRIAGVGLQYSHAEARDFTSDFFLEGPDPIRSRDKFRADGFLRLLPVPVSYAFTATHDRLQSGQRNIDLTARVSTYVRGASISNTLRWQTIGSDDRGDGALNVSSRFGLLSVRGQVIYNLSPIQEVESVAVAATRILPRGYVANAGVTRAIQTGEMRYSAGLTKSIGSYGFGVGLTYSSLGEVIIGGQLFIAVAKEPRRGEWVFDALPMAETGAMSARVFVDKNLNGLMDPGEEPVKGASFVVNGGRHPARTDDDGIAYLRRLPSKAHADVSVDPGSLEDPQWAARPGGVRIVPRAGKSLVHEFPVILTGEIDGTTYIVEKSGKRPLGDVAIEAVNAQGVVASKTRSASDGFYILSAVPPGEYRVRIEPGDLAKRGLADPGSRSVTIGADGTFVNSVDLVIQRIAEAVAAAEANGKPTPPEALVTEPAPDKAPAPSVEETPKPAAKKPAATEVVPNGAPAAAAGAYAVQVAALADTARAKLLEKQMAGVGLKTYTEVVNTQAGDEVTRVRAGPYATREAAEQA
ncbi:MAG TPA: SPOR domain-containing protein, partial [Burkholderiales bacterium]|nr:SPOR domain-containing protein [Burkholderiales bacterium]